MKLNGTILVLILSLGLASRTTVPRSPGERADGPVFETRRPAWPATQPHSVSTGGNIRVNQDASGQYQNETTVAVNPTNPLNIVAVARDGRTGVAHDGFYASFDGGVTWQDGVVTEGTYTYQSDPVVAACADGSFVLSLQSFDGTAGAVFVYRSTDGGLTWPQKSTILSDRGDYKPWITCDTTATSAYANRIYVGYRRGSVSGQIQLKYSDDGGQSWSAAVTITDVQTYVRFGIVLDVGPAGQVYATWYDFTLHRFIFDRSFNGGVTFGTDVVAATGLVPIPDLSYLTGPKLLPAMAVDRSGGAYNGTIYLAFSDYSNGDVDISVERSTDGGVTWSPAVRINDDPVANGADQWFPAVVVDPLGRLIVTFCDTRRAPGTDHYELWGAVSRDGGQTFDTNFLIADTPSNPVDGAFPGDYAGVAATSDRIFPIWPDARAATGEQDLYTDRFPNTFRYDEVDTLLFSDHQTASFVTQDTRFGQDLDYDVVSGLLSELRADGGFTHAGCLMNDLNAPPLVDDREPPPGDGYWYLVRTDGPNGVGTFGDGWPPARPNVRDPLDESIATCS